MFWLLVFFIYRRDPPPQCPIVPRFSIVNSGAYRIINGTCAHSEVGGATLAEEGKCPTLRDIDIPCAFTAAGALRASVVTLVVVSGVSLLLGPGLGT